MDTLFAHVDVETTGYDPQIAELLSIAIVVVAEDAPNVVLASFYERVLQPLSPRFDADTLEWWSQQDDRVRTEALRFGDDRVHLASIGDHIEAFLAPLAAQHDAVIVPVADPGAFDRKWLDYALMGRRPAWLSYRTLCLRSMTYGQDGRPFMSDRSTRHGFVPPEHPHHPLSDALSQAEYLADASLVDAPPIVFLGEAI